MKPASASTAILLAVASVGLGCALFIIFLTFITASHQPTKTAVAPYPAQLAVSPQDIVAKAAIVYDPTQNRILFAKNAQESLPLASLTKIMTAQAVLSSIATDTMVTITPEDLKSAADAGDWGFREGDRVSISNLITFGLVASSNTAMAAAAAAMGNTYLIALNSTADKLGLSQTLFLNSTGLDINTDTSGAYGSALDMARLTAAFLRAYPQYFELTDKPVVSIPVGGGRTIAATATMAPIQNIPGFIGAKTGYTDLAGGNLVAAFDIDIGHPLIAVVLGSTEKGRFSDMRTLIDSIQNQ